MFIGHYAVALGAKKTAPQVSLGTLFFASQFLDLLWPLLLLLGVEHARIAPGDTAFTPLDFYDYPVSHSMLTTLGWSLLVAGIYYVIKRNWRNAGVVGAAVFSHWLLDLLTHRPDLPIAPGAQTLLGLGLWNSILGTICVEGCLFIAAIYFYLKATKAVDRIGTYAFWGLIAFLVFIYAGNVTSPPPPNINMVAIAGMAQWLFVLWAFWIDRHRQSMN
jgi:hypothetical protein